LASRRCERRHLTRFGLHHPPESVAADHARSTEIETGFLEKSERRRLSEPCHKIRQILDLHSTRGIEPRGILKVRMSTNWITLPANGMVNLALVPKAWEQR
jgi:hypothetical protein